jgi:ABC-type glycerol-3-phosphate transport system substrate-binding protein
MNLRIPKELLVVGAFLCVPFLVFASGTADQPADEKASLEGVTINYMCPKTVYYEDGLVPWKGELEARTGMKINIELVPGNAYHNKLLLYLASQDGSWDVVNISSRHLGQALSGNWMTPLKQYIDDPNWTEAAWDVDDIVDWDFFRRNDDIWAMQINRASNILSYNKAMYKEAGLTGPPETLDELMNNAAKVHKLDKGQYGIVLRATREARANGYSWIFFWLINGGYWHEEGRKPYAVLDTEVAIESAEYWVDILQKYGPPGIASYFWTECQVAMQQGAAAHWVDGIPIQADLVNPEKSKTHDQIGFHVIEGKKDKYTVGTGWGVGIPKTTKNQRAAWEFIKWATSKEIAIRQMTDNLKPGSPRASVLNHPRYRELFSDDFADAVAKALSHSVEEYSPYIPQGPQIRDILAIALQKALANQTTTREAMIEANKKVVELLNY